MVSPTGRGGARGPGDGAIAPYAGFAKDAARKDFGVMSKNIGEWGAQACAGPPALSFAVGDRAWCARRLEQQRR